MPCDYEREPRQTVAQRQAEVRKAKMAMDKMIATNHAKVKVDRNGRVVVTGVPDSVRSRVDDACLMRFIQTHGSVAARQAVARAERQAGRSIDKQALAAGVHSHDGGATWGTD